MYRIMAIAIMFMLALTTNVAAADDAKLSSHDKEFVEKAAVGGMTEVRLGQLAAERAANENVKEFGERMVRDHSKANDRLKEIAQQNNISLPKQLDERHRKTVEKLSNLRGKEFDREYMNEMVKDHHKDIELFEKQAQQGKNPELKRFATTTLKTLEEHNRMAKNINQQVDSEARGYYPGQDKKGSPSTK